MSLTTVAELRTALGVGTLYADAVLQEVCDAADNVLLPFLWKNEQSIIAHGNTGTVGTVYFNEDIRNIFYVGQSVTISNAGTKYNGTKTITGVGTKNFTVTTTHTSDNPYHVIAPYGTAGRDLYRLHNNSSHSRSKPYDLNRHLAEPSSSFIWWRLHRWLHT